VRTRPSIPTEDGLRPEFAERFGAAELPGGGSPERTRANARDSDATVWFGDPGSLGGRTTLRAYADLRKPVMEVLDGFTEPSDVANWIEAQAIRVLNVAGNRESTEPGIGDWVERFLVVTFRQLYR
jgi:Circularly permutated YpsA SLOG family